MYFFYEVSGETRFAKRAQLAWRAADLSSVEALSDQATRMRTFLGRFGSHYVLSLQYGARLAVRAELKTLDVERQKALSAQINVGLGKLSAGGGLSASERSALSSGEIAIQAELVGGGVTPSSQAVVLTSLDEVNSFLSDFKAGRVKLISGPVSAKLVSYWPTLDEATTPKLVDDFKDAVRSPAPSPFGVPPGTVIAWLPRAGDIFNTANGPRILPPDGWVLCDGSAECPDLGERFVIGTTSPVDIGKQTGLASVKPTGTGSFGGYRPGEINYQSGPGRPAQYSIVHNLDISTITLRPPSTALVYIMKK